MHISNIEGREEWRSHSVIRDVVIGHVHGKGVDGYRDALEMLKEALS
jgi:3-dehydroquinate dehydratase-2